MAKKTSKQELAEAAELVKNTVVDAVLEAKEKAEEVVKEAVKAVKGETTKIDAKIPEGPLAEKWSNYKAHQKLVNPANKRRLDIIVVGTG